LRKLFLGAIVGAVVLAVAAIAYAETTTTYTQSYTTNKAGKSAGTHFNTTSIDPANTDKNQQPKKTRKLVIGFPKGTKIDQTVKPYCTELREDDPDGNVCPKNTQIGSGSAEVRLQFGGDGGIIPAKVTAYNRKSDGNKGLFLYVVPQVAGQAPVVIKPVFQGTKLVTNLTPLCVPPGTPPSCGDLGEAVLTKFKLDTKAYKKGKGKKVKYFIKTPTKCSKTWKFTADFTYDDASTKHLESTQKCKK
jgi:gas vesicle protein